MSEIFKISLRTSNWRASLVPAAAVITSPMAKSKVVAVQKARSWISAEDSRSALAGEHLNGPGHLFPKAVSAVHCVERYSEPLLSVKI